MEIVELSEAKGEEQKELVEKWLSSCFRCTHCDEKKNAIRYDRARYFR